MAYAEIFEGFPPELRLPIARLVDRLREELGTSRADIDELKAIVRDLAQAQARTEDRLEELAQAQQRTERRIEELGGAIQKLAEAQQHTEFRVEKLEGAVQRLAEAQQRTERHVEELTQAQQRTERHVEELTQAQQRTERHVEELAQAQQRTETGMQELRGAVRQLAEAQTLFHRTFNVQIGGLGARWGIQTEEAFRQGMRTILHEVGFASERFLEYDAAGEVFGQPDQVELDVVVKDGRVIVAEVKSALDSGNTYLFDRKVAFYMRKTGRQVDRKLIVTPYADNRAKEVGLRLGVEICTDITTLQ
jgi:hypothetical protein